MGRERGARALQDLQEHPCSARKLAERAAYSTIIQKSVPLPLPESRLVCLVTDLTMAIAAERTSQVAINYKDQDPVSFARMNARVQALLQAYAAANCHDWRSFARWSDAGYLRHLLHECDDFELMLICWKPGQTSRVHNHADSHCWLAVLAGEVQETQYRPVVPKAEAEAEPHAPAPLSGASPPELSALLLSEAEGSSGCSSLSSSGESNASFAAAQMQAQFSKLQEQRREQAERQAEEQEKGQAEVLCCDDLRLVRTQTRCVQVGGVAYINDGLALHCVGCPAAAECPNAIASTGTNTTSTAANSGSKGPVAGQGSCSGRKGGRAAAAMSSSGGLTALFGRRVNGTIGSGCADALAYPAAADGDMATANGANGWACTLHLYAPPIRRVKAYEAGGHVTECTPGFYSRHVLRP
ncbi:hypothetical protein CHLRE_03g163950v5 [Chlamydomonas reinhardtii]|uniref:cysteine dioxygenase n=1 Tax=Chlamydomonas reinhardtii TaxID=3055 RepID=A0A2K3DWK5_CHLRE|nr:uncharacterized protein CHLRE_03g163950v5 [Chlamydomonas reinhardtii]PNW84917.1 hypothetical protein CHLRE_03g163950v5 [Chlamydomonas reinhardtii]